MTSSKQEVLGEAMKEFLKEEAALLGSLAEQIANVPIEEWEVRQEHVDRAVDRAGSSAPGPDGLAYMAWKKMGVFGKQLLWLALKDLMSRDGLVKVKETSVQGRRRSARIQ